ncbi:MAG TPA: type VI secretion system baseplate subunit TssE, partial [Candidatus Binataceae bacterium]|nr:type VI secretion system baseplate subunit TssE [Candidatus Binataceae bacterium]
YGVEELKASVARDLENLLNTRREALKDLPPGLVETAKSLPMYGMPDFTALNPLNSDDREGLRGAIESAIAAFEARLQRVIVKVDAAEPNARSVSFHVEALLRAEPAPRPVAFDTVLDLGARQYSVRGRE